MADAYYAHIDRLIKLLDAYTPDNQRELQEWLRDTPPHVSADALDAVLRTRQAYPAQSVPAWGTPLFLALIICAIISLVAKAAGVRFFPHPPLFLLISAVVFRVVLTRASGAGRQAALLLATLDDPRAVTPLTQAWQPNPPTPEARAENERIETELTRLVTLSTGAATGPYVTFGEALRKLLKRAARDWRKTARRNGTDAVALTDARADMLLAAVRFLARSGTPEAVAALKEVVDLPVPTASHQMVWETALMVYRDHQARDTGAILPPSAATPVSAPPPRRVTVRKP